ncbi:MAG: bifunctional phosphopantothenoylcysteine decarboxylase/phosphopantothenate--cysteine ligase CoaBC [Clostridia bacterium]|jgi:phosphopantothenoylcysteine decarboxylase/phosphopantothenate--cysteine ligase
MNNRKTVVLGVTGGIAAYKAAEIISRLRKENIQVFVIMTRHATEFITPLTLQTLSGNPVVVDMFASPSSWEIEHISLAQKADLFLIAPASANIIGKLACGIADDMLSTTVMATKAKVLLAPAMNTNMYTNSILQRNIQHLKDSGYSFIDPSVGRLACGDTGIGKLADVDVIVSTVLKELNPKRNLEGKTVLVTAGPTREPIDPVRYISNRSSGKMGFALAKVAASYGAKVSLISGPVALLPPQGVEYVGVETTEDMYKEVLARYEACDIVIKAAAPVDFHPTRVYNHKVKKHTINDKWIIDLEPNPDILKELGLRKKKQILVGFAAETQNLPEYAQKKLVEKNLDMIVANDVTQEGAGFETDTNIVQVITRDGKVKKFPQMEKEILAHHIISEILGIM